MKVVATVLALFITATLFAAPDVAPPAASRPLYLHFLTPNPGSEPPKRILSARVLLAEDIMIAVGRDHETLTGRVEARGDKFFASVKGTFGSSTGFFEGEVELDKPFVPQSYGFSGGVYSTRFVLSASPDCEPYLGAAAIHTQ